MKQCLDILHLLHQPKEDRFNRPQQTKRNNLQEPLGAPRRNIFLGMYLEAVAVIWHGEHKSPTLIFGRTTIPDQIKVLVLIWFQIITHTYMVHFFH